MLNLLMWIGIFWMVIKGLDANWNYDHHGIFANIFQVVCVVFSIIAVACGLGLVGYMAKGMFCDDEK